MQCSKLTGWYAADGGMLITTIRGLWLDLNLQKIICVLLYHWLPSNHYDLHATTFCLFKTYCDGTLTHRIMGDCGIASFCFNQAWLTTKCESQTTSTIFIKGFYMHNQHMNSLQLSGWWRQQQQLIICLEIKIPTVCNLFNTLNDIPALI